MNRIVLCIALAAALIGAAPVASVPPPKVASGRLTFDLAPCPALAAHLTDKVAVEAWFSPIDRPKTTIDRKLTWNARSTPHLALSVDLPQGAYEYAVVGIFAGLAAPKMACDSHLYAVVLSGKTHAISGTMDDGITDPIPALLVAGTLPPGVTAWLVRYDDTPACGTPVDTLDRHQLFSMDVQSGAYYAYDTHLTASNGKTIAAFGLELGWPGDRRRVLRIVAAYPKTYTSPATYIYAPVTPKLAAQLLASPENTLFCEPTANE